MADSTGSSVDEIRRQARERREQIERGEVCECCGLSDCRRDVQRRAILMGKGRGYAVECCSNKARELQGAEDLRQRGIHADMVAGMLRIAGIPERFKEADFANFKVTFENGEALRAAMSLVKHFEDQEKHGRGLVLVGPVGVGKTHLIVSALKNLIAKGTSSRYIYAPDLLGMLRGRSRDAEDASLLDITFRELCSERVIAIDDVGIDRDTDWTVAQFTRILDGRYRTKKVTILGTNLGLEDLESAVGARSMSRLLESNDVVQMAGEDRRLNR